MAISMSLAPTKISDNIERNRASAGFNWFILLDLSKEVYYKDDIIHYLLVYNYGGKCVDFLIGAAYSGHAGYRGEKYGQDRLLDISREQFIEYFIIKDHPTTTWLLFNMDQWNG